MNREHLIFSLQKALMQAYSRMLLRRDVDFEEDLPEGAKILVANHPTTTDPFLLSLLVQEPLYIPITGMAFEVPVFGKILRAAGHIPVWKHTAEKEDVVGQAVEKLSRGKTIGIFPEGQLSPAIGAFGPPKTGAARMALLSGAAVVPIGIYLSQNACFEKQLETESYAATARFAVRGDYLVSVGKAKTYRGNSEDRDLVREVSRQIMADIAGQTLRSQARLLEKQAGPGVQNTATPFRKAFNG
jgi:1-acyl-sn-glycerol-3-phosphate acyltransferase